MVVTSLHIMVFKGAYSLIPLAASPYMRAAHKEAENVII